MVVLKSYLLISSSQLFLVLFTLADFPLSGCKIGIGVLGSTIPTQGPWSVEYLKAVIVGSPMEASGTSLHPQQKKAYQNKFHIHLWSK